MIRRRPTAQAAATVAAILVLVFASAPPAAAHGGASDEGVSTNYRTRILAAPRIDGLAVRVIDAGSRLELSYRGAGELIVGGYQDEPYLRIDASGVFENVRSPATYLNQNRDAANEVPAIADATAAPEWRRVAASNTARWHDHRSHWMSQDRPPVVRQSPDQPHVIFDNWQVPVTVNGVTAAVSGDLTWMPPPSAARWWAATAASFVACLVVLLRLAHRWLRIAMLGVLTGAEALSAAGAAAASVATRPVRILLFTYAAAFAGAAARMAWQARRKAPAPFLVSAFGGLGAVAFAGLARLDRFSNSQIASTLPLRVEQATVVAELAIGGALFAEFLFALRHLPKRTNT